MVASASGFDGKTRHLEFTYTAIVRHLPPTARQVDLWIPVPPETTAQEILSIKFDSPIEGRILTEPRFGNRVWHARFPAPTDGQVVVTQTIELIRYERAGTGYDSEKPYANSGAANRFVAPTRMIPLSDRFARIAHDAVGDRTRPMEKGQALYDHVLERMTYDKSGTGWGRGSANHACDVGKGNCSDFHSFFIALARSLNIPARFWMGFPIPPERGEGTIGGYHCWAEFQVDGRGWIPVDISEADKNPEKREYFFGQLDENRIAFTLGRDLFLPPMQAGPPLNFFIYPYVEVDGEAWDDFERTFTYRDLR